jgi:hypothetical protein
MKFKGDIIITDPCYIIREEYNGQKPLTDDDWDSCEYGEKMEMLGIHNYICRDTLYGDWSCTTYNSDTDKEVGKFCADAGMVAVFLLDEVLKYNPDFDYHLNRPWTTTWIKDFDGEVEFTIARINDGDWIDEEVRVVGKGNVNFITTQTGL